MASCKPDDKTLRDEPGLPDQADESVAAAFQRRVRAPEVNQKPRREQASAQRAVLGPGGIVDSMARSLRVIMTSASHPRVAYEGLREAWLPALRQAIEQAGGDGIDSWLTGLFDPSGPQPAVSFFQELGASLRRMRQSRDVAVLEEEALKTIELVRRVCQAPERRPLSFERMERDLEGTLEIGQLLHVIASSEDELARRLAEIGGTMEQLRDQLRSSPGNQPDGLYANFVHLKAELRVLDGELRRRERSSPRFTPPTG